MSLGSSAGTALNSAAVVNAPLGLAVRACCGHRLSPRKLSVLLPYGMVPGHAHIFIRKLEHVSCPYDGLIG